MKKFLAAIIFISALAVCSAYANVESHVIVLLSIVKTVHPEFALRSNETGAVGDNVVYSTSQIASGDVSTSFDIIQTNNSKYSGSISFDIHATELFAVVNGRTYCTDGVNIYMDGIPCGNTASFTAQYNGSQVSAGTTVKGIEVIWPTKEHLAEANYQAAITLSYTEN